MIFYQNCLGGTLRFQTVADVANGNKLPEKMQRNILQATLIKDEVVLIGTDMVDDEGLIKGNTVSMLLNCTSEMEIRTIYQALSIGSKQQHDLQVTHSGSIFGYLTDQFGNQWLLNYDELDMESF